MKKKFYNCPTVELADVKSYGLCQLVSKFFEYGEDIDGTDPYVDGI